MKLYEKVIKYLKEDATGERLENWSIVFVIVIVVILGVWVHLTL